MGNVMNLTRWEWFKLRRRMMPWVLLAILVALSQLFIWGNFFSYRSQHAEGPNVTFGYMGDDGTPVQLRCREVLVGDVPPGLDQTTLRAWQQECVRASAQHEVILAQMRTQFTPPTSLVTVLGITQSFGLILLAILAASTIGTDYGWGTLRTVLVRGTGRWQYLGAKLLLLSLLGGAALLVIAAVTLASSALAAVLAPEPTALGALASLNESTWGDAAVTLGKAWFALLPYLALAAFVAVWTASSAAGMAVTLAYYFAEQIVVAIMLALFDWFERVAEFALGRNISGWMEGAGGGFVVGRRLGEVPDAMHSFLVLLVYILALIALAFWRFQKRDVTGASGT